MDLLHAANLRHGTDGFTSPPKEGVLRIFFALKIRRLRPGLNRIITQYLKSRKNNAIKFLFTDSVDSWQHGLGAHLF